MTIAKKLAVILVKTGVILSVAAFSAPAAGAEPTPQTFPDGTYLVNQRLPSGTYRSNGKGYWCYWRRSDDNGNIIDNHFGYSGGVVTIQASDYQFNSSGCGGWTALDPNNLPALPVAQQVAPKKDGYYVVGLDIAPGVWKSNGLSSSCYWARYDLTQDINDNELGYAGTVVTIRADDFEFYTKGCGVWTMIDTNNLPALSLAQQRAPKRSGSYVIGLDMAPGRWRSNSLDMNCYWAEQTITQDIIDNHFGAGSVVVDIPATVFEFKTARCGIWVLTTGVGESISSTAVTQSTGTAVTPAIRSSATCPSANVCILSPASGLKVGRGNVVVFTGTAAGQGFARYQFQAGNGAAWGHIADFNKPVVNGTLMELHTDSLPPGTYTIRLQVIDISGNSSADKAQVVLTIQ